MSLRTQTLRIQCLQIAAFTLTLMGKPLYAGEGDSLAPGVPKMNCQSAMDISPLKDIGPNERQRITDLLARPGDFKGLAEPNCWNTVLYVKGFTPYTIFTERAVMAQYFGHFCKKIDNKPPEAGNVIRFRSKGLDRHAAIYLGNGLVFQKPSAFDDSYEIAPIDKVEKQWCGEGSCAEYYECSVEANSQPSNLVEDEMVKILTAFDAPKYNEALPEKKNLLQSFRILNNLNLDDFVKYFQSARPQLRWMYVTIASIATDGNFKALELSASEEYRELIWRFVYASSTIQERLSREEWFGALDNLPSIHHLNVDSWIKKIYSKRPKQHMDDPAFDYSILNLYIRTNSSIDLAPLVQAEFDYYELLYNPYPSLSRLARALENYKGIISNRDQLYQQILEKLPANSGCKEPGWYCECGSSPCEPTKE